MEWTELNTKNYYDFLSKIIEVRGQWTINQGEYFEGHHIIPKSFGGEGDTRGKDSNIIWLYPREHFEAHKILANDNPKCHEVVYAFWMMSNGVSPIGKREKCTKEDYEKARESFIQTERERKRKDFIVKECPICHEKFEVGPNNPKKYCSLECAYKGCKGHVVFEEARRKISLSNSKENNPNYGKHMSEENKEKLRQLFCKDNTIEKECSNCGKKFKIPYNKRKQRYCSVKCAQEKFEIRHIENYSKANSGGNNPRAIKIKCIETNEEFGCIKEARTKFQLSKYSFQKALETGLPLKGYHFIKI